MTICDARHCRHGGHESCLLNKLDVPRTIVPTWFTVRIGKQRHGRTRNLFKTALATSNLCTRLLLVDDCQYRMIDGVSANFHPFFV